MRGVHLVRTEHSAWRNHANRQFSLFHGARLNRRRLSPEHNLFVDIESVLLIFGGMVRRNIQLGKIVLVILNLRSFHHLIAHADKDPLYLV